MKIYMDHAATTPVDAKVLAAMKPFFSKNFGNASSIHDFGADARDALEKSRRRFAEAVNAKPEEIIFTSGGTEADNFALKCFAFANRQKGNHIIISTIEHDAVLNAAKWLEKNGFDVTYLPVDQYGLVHPDVFEKALTNKTILASIMHANNEIGTIEPIEKIGEICRENGVYLHTDAVQSFGKIPFDVEKLNIDLATFSSHKIYGPKGVGAIYIRKGTPIEPLLHGGGHENGFRSGTENVAGIVGFAKAAELAVKGMQKESARLEKLRNKLISEVLKINGTKLNGHPAKRLPNNANFSFKFIEGESLILKLNEKGIAASTGSACSSKSLKPSHVLLACGISAEDAHGSLRLTLGKSNTLVHIKYVVKILPPIVEELRKISPIKSDRDFEKMKEEAKIADEKEEKEHGREEEGGKIDIDIEEAPVTKPAKKHTYMRLTQETDEEIKKRENGK